MASDTAGRGKASFNWYSGNGMAGTPIRRAPMYSSDNPRAKHDHLVAGFHQVPHRLGETGDDAIHSAGRFR